MADSEANVRASMRKRHEQQYKQHLDSLTFRVTLASTVVAVLAALAALWSGYEAHKTRIDDERPFIAVDVVPVSETPSELGPPAINTISAFGKTPARNIKVSCISYPDPLESRIQWKSVTSPDNVQYPFLLPSRSIRILCPLSKLEHDSYNPSTLYPYYTELGIVEYSGANNDKYLTPFCVTMMTGKDAIVIPCNGNHGLPDLR
jgi:hypothetical protein